MKFLYVEDIEMNAKIFSIFVERIWDVPITIATTAEEGLKLIEEQKFDLIYMDINLPFMNGIDAVKIIREEYNEIDLPIIMVSADVNNNTIENARIAGANGYITKPIKMDRLKETTEENLNLKKS